MSIQNAKNPLFVEADILSTCNSCQQKKKGNLLEMPNRQHLEGFPRDELLTLEETAAFLKVKRRTIYNLVELRKIPFLKAGRLLRFSRSALMNWMQEEADRQA